MGEKIMYGKIILSEQICNITSIMNQNNKGAFNVVQGYTVSPDYMHLLIMKDPKIREDLDLKNCVMARSSRTTGTVTSLTISEPRSLRHGNDCTYYNGNFYVAQGGGTKDNIYIKCFNADTLNLIDRYGYEAADNPAFQPEPLRSVACITHISGKYFILGIGRKYSVCILQEANKIFKEISRFKITDSDYKQLYLDGEEPLGQGIYYTRNQLYKVFSYNINGAIVHNCITIFDLSGSSPEFTGLSLREVYSCNKTSNTRFEVEDISSPDDGKPFYIAVNSKTGTVENDSIYKIAFQAPLAPSANDLADTSST